MSTRAATSWVEHLAAATAMGLSPVEALELYQGWPARVRESRERMAAMTAWLDAREMRRSDSYPAE